RDRIAVFCHNGSAQTWLAHLLAIPLTLFWSSFWLAPSSVTTVLFDERSTDWAVPRCLSVGDLSHLYAAGLPAQPKGILANFD
ncbi:MAG: histidine phosphatase family protein, partial [Thermomicrobiales bacterium]